MDKTVDSDETLLSPSVNGAKDVGSVPTTPASVDSAVSEDVASFFDLRALARAYRFGELSHAEYLARRRALIAAFQVCLGMEDETLQATPVASDALPADFFEKIPLSDEHQACATAPQELSDDVPSKNNNPSSSINSQQAQLNGAPSYWQGLAPEDQKTEQHAGFSATAPEANAGGLSLSDVYSKVAASGVSEGADLISENETLCQPLDLDFGLSAQDGIASAGLTDEASLLNEDNSQSDVQRIPKERFSFLTWRGIAITGLLVASGGMAIWLAVWLTGM